MNVFWLPGIDAIIIDVSRYKYIIMSFQFPNVTSEKQRAWLMYVTAIDKLLVNLPHK